MAINWFSAPQSRSARPAPFSQRIRTPADQNAGYESLFRLLPKAKIGANPKREDARVAAAMWAGADVFEQRPHSAV
jgi:hypothetical protein